jgi:fructose 1,6-bisphosphate aldolase/phosphatase
MQITLSVIKADIGSIGGHIAPSKDLIECVRRYVAEHGQKLLIDYAVSHTGDDIAILMTHTRGVKDERIHRLAWDAFVAGCMRGSHQMPLMPAPLNTGTSYFDGPPIVSCAAYAMHEGCLTEALDAFAHPFWHAIRDQISRKAVDMRRQGFFGAAMLPMAELEYTGIIEKLAALEPRFRVRG